MSAYPQTRRPAGAPAPGRTPACGARAARHFVTLALALLATALLLLSRPSAGAELVLSVSTAPPPLPVYEQPPLPAEGYIWSPGYWSYGPDGYFWVPGTWVLPPDPDLLWTPGYWGFADGLYVWNPGYWAPVVGFYGGIVYGFGYFGHGYEGGYWRDHKFYYNRAANNVSETNITNVYNTKVTNVTVSNVSYNGGPGGVAARPTAQEQAAARQPRHAATSEQNAQAAGARGQRDLLAAVNQGHPAVAATPKPNTFSGPGIAAARAEGHPGAQPPRHLAQAPPQTAAPQTTPPPPTHERPAPSAARPPHSQRPEEHPPQ